MTDMQQKIINASLEGITLINGYAGVGKTTVLLKRYEELVNGLSIDDDEIILLVNDSLKKAAILRIVDQLNLDFNVNVNTIYELIAAYLHFNDLDLFNNTLSKEQKNVIISNILDEQKSTQYRFPLDFIVNEINFIQETIFVDQKDTITNLLDKEFKQYALTSRKSPSKNVLTYQEKEVIWSIYRTFLTSVLEEDVFDEFTFFQSILRLMVLKGSKDTIAFRHILIDDVEDFTPIQLSIIHKFYKMDEYNHHIMMTHDPLKSIHNTTKLAESYLFKHKSKEVTLNENFRANQSTFKIIKSNIENNPLFKNKIEYTVKPSNQGFAPVLSFFHKQTESNPKQLEVLFDRLDLLVKTYDYKLSDILIVFCDESKLDLYKEEFSLKDLNVFTLHERMTIIEQDAITFVSKNALVNIEFPIVFILDANEKFLCQSPVNTVTNLERNMTDSIAFYKMLSIAKDQMIINTSKSNPSFLLLPGSIDYKEFRYEIGSKFILNTNYNIYRKSEIKGWIKDQMISKYGYTNESFETSNKYDLIATTNQNKKIGITILDDKTNLEVKETLNFIEYDYLMFIDEYHYMMFECRNSNLERIKDIPYNK